MRAKDIKLGAELYYSTQAKWAQGRSSAFRVVVVDPTVQSWEQDPVTLEWRRARFQSMRMNPPGALVDMYVWQFDSNNERTADKVMRTTARTVDLRGPWDECSKIAEQAATENRLRYEEERRQRRADERVVEVAELACQRLGIDVSQYRFTGTSMVISADALTAMCHALAGTDFRYRAPETDA